MGETKRAEHAIHVARAAVDFDVVGRPVDALEVGVAVLLAGERDLQLEAQDLIEQAHRGLAVGVVRQAVAYLVLDLDRQERGAEGAHHGGVVVVVLRLHHLSKSTDSRVVCGTAGSVQIGRAHV